MNWHGESRPVVALSVGLAWQGGFDAETMKQFVEWLRKRYPTIAELNAAWETDLARFEVVDPKDTAVFDYAHLQAGQAEHSQAVEDHIEFRSQVIAESLGKQAAFLRQKHPNVLILPELPYQFASNYLHPEGYRIGYVTNPSCTRSADILFFRCTGLLSEEPASGRSGPRRQGNRAS